MNPARRAFGAVVRSSLTLAGGVASQGNPAAAKINKRTNDVAHEAIQQQNNPTNTKGTRIEKIDVQKTPTEGTSTNPSQDNSMRVNVAARNAIHGTFPGSIAASSAAAAVQEGQRPTRGGIPKGARGLHTLIRPDSVNRPDSVSFEIPENLKKIIDNQNAKDPKVKELKELIDASSPEVLQFASEMINGQNDVSCERIKEYLEYGNTQENKRNTSLFLQELKGKSPKLDELIDQMNDQQKMEFGELLKSGYKLDDLDQIEKMIRFVMDKPVPFNNVIPGDRESLLKGIERKMEISPPENNQYELLHQLHHALRLMSNDEFEALLQNLKKFLNPGELNDIFGNIEKVELPPGAKAEDKSLLKALKDSWKEYIKYKKQSTTNFVFETLVFLALGAAALKGLSLLVAEAKKAYNESEREITSTLIASNIYHKASNKILHHFQEQHNQAEMALENKIQLRNAKSKIQKERLQENDRKLNPHHKSIEELAEQKQKIYDKLKTLDRMSDEPDELKLKPRELMQQHDSLRDIIISHDEIGLGTIIKDFYTQIFTKGEVPAIKIWRVPQELEEIKKQSAVLYPQVKGHNEKIINAADIIDRQENFRKPVLEEVRNYLSNEIANAKKRAAPYKGNLKNALELVEKELEFPNENISKVLEKVTNMIFATP